MTTKRLQLLRLLTAILSRSMGIISLVYAGISINCIRYRDWRLAFMFVGLSAMIAVIMLITAELHDTMVAELDNRIQRKLHRAGGDTKVSKNIA